MNLLNREKDKPKLVPPVPPTSVGSLSQEAKFGLLGLLALSLPNDDHAAPRGRYFFFMVCLEAALNTVLSLFCRSSVSV